MSKQIKRKQIKVNVLEMTKAKGKNITISISNHPNGKLVLPKMSKKKAIKILEIKGYI